MFYEKMRYFRKISQKNEAETFGEGGGEMRKLCDI